MSYVKPAPHEGVELLLSRRILYHRPDAALFMAVGVAPPPEPAIAPCRFQPAAVVALDFAAADVSAPPGEEGRQGPNPLRRNAAATRGFAASSARSAYTSMDIPSRRRAGVTPSTYSSTCRVRGAAGAEVLGGR